MDIDLTIVGGGNLLLSGGGGGCFVLITVFPPGSVGLLRRFSFCRGYFGQMGEFINCIGPCCVVFGRFGERLFEFVPFVLEKFGEHHLDCDAKIVTVLCWVLSYIQDLRT